MNGLRTLVARLHEFLTRGRVERELSEELQTHLDLLTDEHVRRGLTRDEARRMAMRDLGGVEQTRELVRDRRGFRWVEALMQDIRFGARLLVKTPGFSLAAIITLALGIGANTAVFSVVDAVLLRPLPYPDPHRVVEVWEVNVKTGERMGAASPANYTDYVRRADAFTSLAAYSREGGNLTGAGAPERLVIEQVTAPYFAATGVMPMIGRPFSPADQEDGASQVVIITHGLWMRRFGGQASIIEQSIELDGRPHRVVGVMPAEFRSVSDAGGTRAPGDAVSAFVPLGFEPGSLTNRREFLVSIVGRVKPGVSLEAAAANLAAVSEGLAREFPDAGMVRTALGPLGTEQTKAVRPLLLMLLGAVGLVLLIACANVASLLVARAMARQREIAVRFALGATRRRVMSELITQSLLLSGAGTLVGLALAYWTKNTLVALAPATFPDIQRAALDLRVLSFAGVLTIATGLIFGALPAWQVSKTRPVEALRTSDRSSVGAWALRNRTALMAVEVALSTLLLVGAGLMLRSLMAVNAVPLGFDPTGVLAANVTLPMQRYATPQSRLDFYESLATRVATIPGVRGVAYSNRLPLRGNWSSGFTFDEPTTAVPSDQSRIAGFQAVNPEYFAVFKIPLLRGRQLAAMDRSGAPGVAVVNAAFVQKFFGSADPVGQRLRRGPKMPPIELVGVVADIRRGGRTANLEPQVYLAAAQIELYPLPLSDLAIRVEGPPERYADAVRDAIWAIDANQPVTNVRTLEEVLSLRLAERHFQTFLFGLFAVLALALAVVGVYSVVDYAARQRTAEIGLRIALGADAPGIIRWMIGQSFWIVAGGSVAGLAAASGLSRYVRTLLFGIEPTDLVTYFGAAAVLAAAALMASYLAARRAVRVDPVSALR